LAAMKRGCGGGAGCCCDRHLQMCTGASPCKDCRRHYAARPRRPPCRPLPANEPSRVCGDVDIGKGDLVPTAAGRHCAAQQGCRPAAHACWCGGAACGVAGSRPPLWRDRGQLFRPCPRGGDRCFSRALRRERSGTFLGCRSRAGLRLVRIQCTNECNGGQGKKAAVCLFAAECRRWSAAVSTPGPPPRPPEQGSVGDRLHREAWNVFAVGCKRG
jgi:hypothetical protein